MNKIKTVKNDVGIKVSTPGVKCGFCPKIIWKDSEPNGRLFILAGKPICVVCRLKRGKNWKYMAADTRKKQPIDLKRIETDQQNKADRAAEDVAIKTMDSETALKK